MQIALAICIWFFHKLQLKSKLIQLFLVGAIFYFKYLAQFQVDSLIYASFNRSTQKYYNKMIQEDQLVEDITILQKDQVNIQLGKTKETQSAKDKVTAFKNRVFSLLMLFVEKSKNTSKILPLITQELFVQLPDKVRQLVNALINRDALSQQELLRIAQFYKNLLLYKSKKDFRKFSEDFIKILRKIFALNKVAASQIIQEMLESFITKRKCKLNFSFFPFILKKLSALRQNIIASAIALKEKKEVRPAQQRVVQKLLKTLVKKNHVKEEHDE